MIAALRSYDAIAAHLRPAKDMPMGLKISASTLRSDHAAAIAAASGAFMSETSDLAAWDLAEPPIVVISRYFVERQDFPPI